MAVAKEREMMAEIQEMKARVVEAEPKYHSDGKSI